MRANVSSLEGELGKKAADAVSDDKLNELLARGFAELLGEMEPGSI